MDAIGYCNACKEKLGISTNYALWKATDIPENYIGDYYRGKRVPDEFACFKFAEILEMSPAIVIAEINASNMKKPDKALFFKHFLTAVGLWIILAVIPVSYSTFSGNVYAAGNSPETGADTTYTPIMRSGILSRWRRYWLDKYDIFVAYFTCNWTRKVQSRLTATAYGW